MTGAIVLLEPSLGFMAAGAWCCPLLLLIAPIWRIVRRRARALDPLWAVLMLGVLNRLASDFGGMPEVLTHLSAVLMAATLSVAIWSYQHADR